MSTQALNKNNSAVKRIMAEARELANDPSTDYTAAPLEDDIFEWHCTLRGPEGTEFEGGLYHFRILLPAEYPFRPPSLMMLTPNGRFELNTKICISFTNYHEELWQPAWGVRTAIVGLQGFFPLKGQQAVGVGSIESPPAERKRLAALSRGWVCPHCEQSNLEMLPDPPQASGHATEGHPASVSEASQSGDSHPEPLPEVSPEQQQQSLGSTAIPNSDAPSFPTAVLSASSVPPARSTESSAAEGTANPTSSLDSSSSEPSTINSRGASQNLERSFVNSTSTVHSTSSGSSLSPRSSPLVAQTGVGMPTASESSSIHSSPSSGRRESRRPPLLLDTAICILLVMAVAIIFRRVI